LFRTTRFFPMEQCAMPKQQFVHRANAAVLTVAMMSLAVSAFGQTGQSPQGIGRSLPHISPSLQAAGAAQAAASMQQRSGPVRQLTADEAVKLALEQNLGLQIERINPEIQDVSVAQSRSFWAPQLTSSLSTNSTNTQNTSSLAGAQSTLTSGLVSGAMG